MRYGRRAGIVFVGIVLTLSGCGGGGNSGGTTPPASSVTSVTASCSPSSILTGQTSTCTATVTGTGSYSSSVNWSVSPASIGAVSSAGVFTPTGTGTATITASSTQDATKSGSTKVTITDLAPTFANIAPASGYAGGGTAFTITGANFRSGATVTIGGTSALSVSIVNATTITALAPAHATGTADVVITNADTSSVTGTSAFTFTANPIPTVSGTTPNSVLAGSSDTTISITGTGFTEQSTASFDGIAINTSFVSSTQLSTQLPAQHLAFAHLAELSVTNPAPGGGTSDAGAAFTAGPNVPIARYGQTATVLQDGRILVCGGADGNSATSSAAVYDPSTNQFTAVGPMTGPRFRHTATLLKNGKVLITGGEPSVVISNMITNGLATAEIFDPVSGTFSAITNMQRARTRHTATLLSTGKVLLVGGDGYAEFMGIQPQIFTELFDPATNTFSAGPQSAYDRMGQSAVSMKDGTVLILGGISILNGNYGDCLNATESYDPTTNSFTTVGSMLYGRSLPATTIMSDGRVFVAGGMSNTGVVGSVEIYDPTSQKFSPGGQLIPAVLRENATLLADGRILVTGGVDNTYSYSSAQIYDPSKGTFSAIPDMNHQRFFASAVLLASGNVLIIGGTDDGSEGLSSTEIFSSANLASEYLFPIQNPMPEITSTSPTAPVVGDFLTINGTGFNNSTEIWIDGNSIQYMAVTPTQMSIQLPTIYGQYSFSVLNPAPGGGQSNFQQIAHVSLVAAPSNPNWLPSSVHELDIAVLGGGSPTFNIREGSNCGTINSNVTSNNVPVCVSCSYSTPVTSEICHLDFVSTIDPAATTTITASISSSATHATSISLQSEHDTGAGATLLKNGNVLITGGGISLYYNPDYFYFTATESANAEVYNAASRTTTAVGNMTVPRAGHTSTLLQNGKVLITGGALVPTGYSSQTPSAITSAEIFDPATNTFSATGSMAQARFYHFAALLPSGDVLIAGSCSGVESQDQATEIYQVSSGTFKTGPSMVTSHCGGQATTLASGKILITSSDFNISNQLVNTADLYDPATGSFTSVGPMVQQRSEHTATLLQDGRVLLIGGYQDVALFAGWPLYTDAPTATTEYFDPTTNSFSAGPDLAFARELHAAALLPTGTVVVAGGFSPNPSQMIGGGIYQSDLEAISSAQVVSGIGVLNVRVQPSSVLLNDGSLFMVGGFFDEPTLTADLVTFGVPVSANPAPSITFGQANTGVLQGYDIAPGAVVLQDGQTQPSSTSTSEGIKYTAPTPNALHTIQIQNPDEKLSNIVSLSE